MLLSQMHALLAAVDHALQDVLGVQVPAHQHLICTSMVTSGEVWTMALLYLQCQKVVQVVGQVHV